MLFPSLFTNFRSSGFLKIRWQFDPCECPPSCECVHHSNVLRVCHFLSWDEFVPHDPVHLSVGTIGCNFGHSLNFS
ncbi:hydrolase [Corchorus olitorius]|uniref:Hydrolase n=1 Tax=Corchorus olitorius TaxID=93759 RepID=A0A1R3JUX3_9ROSI|nr:hydrolase [Corchorus olitorius]